jgi:DNA-binding response OmpR family regulator
MLYPESTMPKRYGTILVVEDEATFSQVVTRNLEARGHAVLRAETATEALRHLSDSMPDLMLLDINLPDRSGWDVLRELRDRGTQVPTVIVSAVRVNPARLEEFQPVAYLPKPFPLDALLRLVDAEEEPAPTEVE